MCAIVGIYLLGLCKSWPCSVFWLQFLEVGDDSYYESTSPLIMYQLPTLFTYTMSLKDSPYFAVFSDCVQLF